MKTNKMWGVALSAIAIGIAAPAAHAGEYCNEIVPPHTDCANNPGHPWDWWNGLIYVNMAEYPGVGEVSVCEHAYRRDTGATVSDRCASVMVESKGDLTTYFNNDIELSGHVGNNAANNHTINGYTIT